MRSGQLCAPEPRGSPAWLLICGGERTCGCGSGVCRALALPSDLSQGVCANLPELGGRRAGSGGSRESGAQLLAPGFSTRLPGIREALRAVAGVSAYCGRAGCSQLTSRVKLGLVWRPGSCRFEEWCARRLWVKSRGGRRRFGAASPSGQRWLPATAWGRCLGPPPGDFERTPRSRTAGASPRVRSPKPACLPPAFHLGFLPSFQSVELLSCQVRRRPWSSRVASEN